MSEDEIEKWIIDDFYQEDIIEKYNQCRSQLNKIGKTGKQGGSQPGRLQNVNRKRAYYSLLLMQDYFNSNAIYGAQFFRRRFRMRKQLFERILSEIVEADSFFCQRFDALKVSGLTPHQKVCMAVRMLATGNAADDMDDRYRMGESTALQCLQRFCQTIIDLYGDSYLRSPTVEDLERLLKQNSNRGFPGMLGSVDCMHWEWKNCPKAWAGQYKGRKGSPTIVLEAISDRDLWIWHAFFGMPGSNNDINVLDRSTLFHDAMNGKAPIVCYKVNGRDHKLPYFLADGIYPDFATFVKTIANPVTEKQKLFAKMQESARKDVERAFGVLQARFHILTMPCRLWSADAMHSVIIACIILHNMIIDDERELKGQDEFPSPETTWNVIPVSSATVSPIDTRRSMREIESKLEHRQLTSDLVEHLWAKHGEN